MAPSDRALATSYRVVQKNGYSVLFWDNFGSSAPILTILSLLQAEIYGASALSDGAIVDPLI